MVHCGSFNVATESLYPLFVCHLNCSVSETRWKSATKRLMRVDSSSPLDTQPKTPKPKIAWLLARSLFIRQIRTYCRGDRTRRTCRRATYNERFVSVCWLRFKQNNSTKQRKQQHNKTKRNQGRDWRPAAGCNGNLGGRACLKWASRGARRGGVGRPCMDH